METKLNIAKILKGKPVGTKLWTDMFGSVTLYVVTNVCDAFQVKHHNKEPWFDKDGTLCKEGVLCIYPSKEMRDWSKFAWNPGDILVNKNGNVHIIFEGFDDDTYETFNGNNYLWENEGITMCFEDYEDDLQTSEFYKANKEDAQKYIHKIEGRLGGKLNLETLEIEKTQPEFKKGDIAFADYGYKQAVFIVSSKTNLSEGYNSFIALDLSDLILDMGCRMSFFRKDLSKLRLATEEEKQQLFDAFVNIGKAWDAEKKEIIDLKPKGKFRPFDKVVACCVSTHKWECDMFSHYSKDYRGREIIIGLGGLSYYKALPYNEENAKLLGTTDNTED